MLAGAVIIKIKMAIDLVHTAGQAVLSDEFKTEGKKMFSSVNIG